MSLLDHPAFLRSILLLDAATGAASGLPLLLASSFAERLTGLPASFLLACGLSLLPIAAFMAFIGTRRPIPAAGVGLIIAGNLAWALASLWLIVAGPWPMTAAGSALVLTQALGVAMLAALEYAGLRRLRLA